MPEFTVRVSSDSPLRGVEHQTLLVSASIPAEAIRIALDSTSTVLPFVHKAEVLNYNTHGFEYPEGAHVLFEYDADHWGGDYKEVGSFAVVPGEAVKMYGAKEAFRNQTGLDPVHIVAYSLYELVDMFGDPMQEAEA